MAKSNISDMLEIRKGIAERMLKESEEKQAAAEAGKAMKLKGGFAKGGTALGTLIGAVYGQPQLGAQIGSAAGSSVGGLAAETQLKSKGAKKKFKEQGGEKEDPIAKIIGSLAKYQGALGSKDGVYEGESDILNERI